MIDKRDLNQVIVMVLSAAIFSGLIAVHSSLLAADGDIVLIRQVQPRAAARPPVKPDPNPLIVNPKPSTYVGEDLQMRHAPREISDSDFATITSGASMVPQVPSSALHRQHHEGSGLSNHSSMGNNTPVGRAGHSLGNIDGQVNRSIQQGLSPLQNLQR